MSRQPAWATIAARASRRRANGRRPSRCWADRHASGDRRQKIPLLNAGSNGREGRWATIERWLILACRTSPTRMKALPRLPRYWPIVAVFVAMAVLQASVAVFSIQLLSTVRAYV